MPNKNKSARERAMELMLRNANNGTKNTIRRDGSTKPGSTVSSNQTNTTTTSQSTSTSQSTNSSTTAQKSSQTAHTTSQGGSQGTSYSDKFYHAAGRKYTNKRRVETTTPGSSGRGKTTTANSRRTTTPRHRVDDEVKSDRPSLVVGGAGKQFVGGHIAGVGTAMQQWETDDKSILEGKYIGGENGRKKYNTRRSDRLTESQAKEKAEGRRMSKGSRGVGVSINDFERVYDVDPNSLSQKLIKKGDEWIESGGQDIEQAKEGLGTVGKVGVDLVANGVQMLGDRALALIPVVGQALAMGSLMNRAGGTASYEARQSGMNADQQFQYALGTSVIEGLSEAMFNSVSAFKSTYGKGALSIADNLSFKAAASGIVNRVLKSDTGRAIAYNLARLGGGALEEGTEELVAGITEPALKYMIMKSTDPNATYDVSLKDLGYDFMIGALMGGIPGSVDMIRGVKADVNLAHSEAYKAFEDGNAYAQQYMDKAMVQGRMQDNGRVLKTDAEVLAEKMQKQIDNGGQVLPGQTRRLMEALNESYTTNETSFRNKRARNYQEAAKKGETNNVVSSGSRAENEEFSGVSYEKELEYEDQARDLMGDNAKEESVEAVGRVLASTADSADVDTVLLDPDAKAALEILAPELQDSNLPVKHAEAREVIENVISSREIATRDSRLQEAQDRYAKNIEASLGNMREGAKELLSSNYQNAVSAMGDGSGGIYKELFNRIYIDGTTKGADFEKTYDNIIANNDKAIQEAFPKEFAKKIFDQGRMANVATVAKETAQAKAAKYAEQNKIEAHIEEAAKKYVDQQTFEDIDKFAKRSKVRVEIVEHLVAKDDNGNILYDENGKELRANGKYENGVIYIAADSDNKFITIAKHELTHHIKEISPERYQELEDFVFQRWYNSDSQAMQDAIVKYQKLYQNITPQQAKEEIIADASEAFFTDEGAIQDVCSFSGKLAKALSDGIHSLLDTFLAIQNADIKARGLGGQFLKQMNILKDAERMWAEALDESVNTDRDAKNGANGSDGVKRLYDIIPIKKVEGAIKSATPSTNQSISQPSQKSNKKNGSYSLSADSDGNKLSFRQKQLEIIRNSNPMLDSYHTGIREVWDIQTARDAFEKRGFVSASDWTYEDGQKALEDGKVTIYSSKPIVNGAFVTPSMQEAINYAGDGNFYQAEVPLEDVAWIDSIEGQYAKTSDEEIKSIPRFSITLAENRAPKPYMRKDGNDVIVGDELFKDGNGNPLMVSGLEITADTMNIMGKNSEVPALKRFFKRMANYMRKMGETYTFIGLEDVQNATLQMRYDKDGKPVSIVVSAMVKNGEYPVNFDFSSICKKRQALSKLFEELSKKGENGENFLDTVELTQENLWEINKILSANGFETACLGCFVETKRYNIEDWAAGFVEKWNKAVKAVNPNAKYFDFASSTDIDYGYVSDELDKFAEEKANEKKKESNRRKRERSSWKKKWLKNNPGKTEADAEKAFKDWWKKQYNKKTTDYKESWFENPALSNDKQITALVNSSEKMQGLLRKTDLISPKGLKALMGLHHDFYGVLYGHYGSGTPKPMVSFTPYNSEIALLDRKMNRDGTMKKYTKEDNDKLIKQLIEIGGVRVQSFSDFLIQNTFDYLQMISDLAARDFPAHAYTKEIAFAKIFGMTGMKINLSVMFDVDPNGIAPGLDKDGNYVVADRARQEKEKKKGNQVFQFSIPYDEAVKLQNQKGYDGNIGIIGVGLSDLHIRKMLNDINIKMVIPYHSSGMPAILKQLTGLGSDSDYTSTQNTLDITKIVKDGKDVTKQFNKEYMLDLYKKTGSWKKAFAQFRKDTEGCEITTKKAFNSVGDFPLYTGDSTMSLDATNDPKLTAEYYMGWCVEQGHFPLFYQFADEENYYKVLYDFNVYHNDGTYAPQQAVTNTYPTDLAKTISYYMNKANNFEQAQMPRWGETIEETKKMLKSNSYTDETKAKANGGKLSLSEDSDGNKLTKAQQKYFKDSKVRDKNGNLLVMYHGTDQAGFNTFKVGAMFKGIFFSSSRRTADAYGGNADSKLYNPNERETKTKATVGNFGDTALQESLRDFHFDTKEDYEKFVADHPGIENVRSEYELQRMLDEEEITENEYDKLRKLLKDVQKDYGEYERDHMGVATWQDLIDNPDAYGFNDFVRAIYAYDREASIDEGYEPDTKESLLEAMKTILAEDEEMRGKDETPLSDLSFAARLPIGQDSEYVNKVNNRTYKTYVNLVNPLIVDAKGRNMNEGYYSYLEQGLKDNKYDGVIIKNVRIGKYNDEGYVVVAKEPNQVKLTSNENPTENDDIRYSISESSDLIDRYITDRQKRINDGEQMSFFGSLNETLPSKPKEKTLSEQFYDDAIKTIADIRKKGGWTGNEITHLLDEVIGYQDFKFIERLNDKSDDNAQNDFTNFLTYFTDEEMLRLYKWYFSQYRIDKYWKTAFRSGKMKFNKLIDKRAEEIRAGKAGGRDIGIEKRDYTATEMRQLFNELNTDKELSALAKKVFDCIDKNFKVRYQGVSNIKGFNFTNEGTFGEAGGRTVHLNMKYFNSGAYTDQQKAHTLLHESIHTVTVYAINLYHGSDPYTLSFDIRQACEALDEVYNSIKYDKAFENEYGITNVKEMVAELSNPLFRAKLKAKNLYGRIVNAIKKMLGIKSSNDTMSAYTAANNALETLLNNADAYNFEKFANRVSSQYNGKFSLSESSEAAPTTKEYKSTVKKLEEQVADLKAEFKRTNLKTADPKQVRIQAGRFLKRHDANNSLHGEVVDTFNKIFGLYKEKGTDAFDEVYEIAQKTAVDVVNSISVIHDEGAEDYKAIKDYLKNTEIKVSDEMKRNITDYTDFRKHNFGRLKLVNGETSNIDNVYMELMEMFPGQFTEDYVNPADQLYHIVDVLDNYAPYYESLDGASEEMQDYVVEIASDIMETAYNLQTKKTFADKKYEQKIKAVKKAREEALASRKKALNRQKERYEKKLEYIKQKKEERRARKKDSEARTKLLNIARRLSKIKSTEEFNNIRDALIGQLDLEAKSMTGRTKIKLEDLQKWYEDQVENNDWFVRNEKLEEKFKRLNKTHIADMNIEDVENLTDILLMLEHKIRNDKKLINSQYQHDVFRAAIETNNGIKESKGLKFFGLHKIDDVFVGQTLSPVRYMRRLVGYDENNPLMIATRELQEGQIKSLDYRMNALKPFNRFSDLKFVSYLNGRKAPEIEVDATTIDMKPTTVKITPAIKIWFYLSSLNEDNMRHIVNGGVHIPDVKLLKAGKRTDAYDKGQLVRFSKSQVQAIIDGMTAQEKAYAAQVYNYFNNVAPQATNEVSEQLDGITVAKVKNYLRISVDKNFLDVDADIIKRDGTLENMGSHKERVKSSKPVYAEDISDVLMNAIEADSKYVGMAIPIRNFNKIYRSSSMEAARGEAEHKQITGTVDSSPAVTNGMPSVIGDEDSVKYKTLTGGYLSVQETIKKMWSSDAIRYIDKFISDLQFAQKPAGVVERALRSLTSNYAGAVLTLNASVAIKQVASFPTAAAVVGWKPLIKSMGRLGKLDLDYVDSVTPLLNYRTEGFNFRETGDIQNRGNRDGFFQRATRAKALNWIQGMDVLTTRKLFKAAQIYVEDNFKLKKGSEAYDKKVAEVYNRIITETQPNYTTMERPGHLRSDSTLERTLSMFKTQPYQNFNIWYDATGNYLAKRAEYKKTRTEENRKALKEASQNLLNATTSQIVQLAVFAAMNSLWALFRRRDDKYRDEDGNITFASYMKQLAKDMLGGASAEIFLGSEVFSAIDSIVNGTYYTGFSSVTDSSINDILSSMKDTMTLVGKAFDHFTKGEEAETTTEDLLKQLEKVATEAGRFTGVPTGNVRNLINATYGWVAMASDGKYIGTYEAQKMSFAKDAEMKANLFQAYRNDKTAYDQIRAMMIEDGFKEDSLDSYIKEQSKEHKTDSEQKTYDKSMQTLEGSSLWTSASAEDQARYSKVLEKLAVGIDDGETASYTKKMESGLSAETIILYKLALKKVDKPNSSGNLGTYTNDEKEAALRLLGSGLSSRQKDTLKG